MDIRQPVPVVIFCGGKGTRLKEETEYKPKPMVNIGGRPILWHIMKGYAHHGYNHFILCLGYKGHAIKEYFLHHQMLGGDFHLDTSKGETTLHGSDDFKITFAETGESTLTGERLLMVEKYIPGDSFMVTYGDGVSDINVNTLHDYHLEMEKEKGVVGTITGVHPRSKYGLVQTNEDGIIQMFKQKPVLSDYTNGGFMVFNKGFMKYLKPNQMVEDAMIDATAEGKLALYNHEGFWHCMDTYQDMDDLNKIWELDPKWKVWKNGNGN